MFKRLVGAFVGGGMLILFDIGAVCGNLYYGKYPDKVQVPPRDSAV
ncbi:MAG: hypothetical protein LBS53_06535 [Synergistaceae bacterium]|jgi:hypothetical protein|nr:hypothetical protein [Synergistaceae bacterium]